jgi:hypothetical protein
MIPPILAGAGYAYGAYQAFRGGQKMYQGFKEHDGQKIAGGGMQMYGAFTGPVMKGASWAAKAVHTGSVFGARMAIPQERQELRNRLEAGVQVAADMI